MKTSKHCYGCGTDKPVSEFYKCSSHSDGLSSPCKSCDDKRRRTWGRQNRTRQKRIQQRSIEKNYSKILERNRAWSLANPEKVRTRSLVYRAVVAGRLVRPKSCSRCGKRTKVEGHHEDYSKPLEVTWVCRSCHRAIDHPRKP